MRPYSLASFAGPLALLTGALFVVAQLVLLVTLDMTDRPATFANPVFVAAQVVYFIAFSTLLLALIAVHERQAGAGGAFGVVAFTAAVVGTMFLAGDLWFDAFAGPWLIDVAPDAATAPTGSVVAGAIASYAMFAVGWVMFGLASLRSRVYPLPIGIAIVVGGALGFFALMPPFGVALGLAIGSLGIWLLRAPARAVAPTPALA